MVQVQWVCVIITELARKLYQKTETDTTTDGRRKMILQRRSGLWEFMPENCGFVVREKALSDYLNYQYSTDEICVTSYWKIQI